jgi:chromosome segregation ATPase
MLFSISQSQNDKSKANAQLNATTRALHERVMKLERMLEDKNSETEKQNQLMEHMEQVNTSLKNRVTELEAMVERLNDESEKHKQILEDLEQVNTVLRAKNNNLAEEISSLSVDLNVSHDQKEQELIAKVKMIIFFEIVNIILQGEATTGKGAQEP